VDRGARTDVAFEVRFLERLQRLLAEGNASSTYKFAVLIGLAELAVETWTERGGYRESFTTRELAEKVLGLYWPQARPLATRGPAESSVLTLLKQNAGPQARIVSDSAALVEEVGHVPVETLARKHPDEYANLVDEVEWKLVEMPLPRVQRLADGVDEFIYVPPCRLEDVEPRGGRMKREVRLHQAGKPSDFNNNILMKPCVVPTLARFHGLVRDLVEARWVREVRKFNKASFRDEDLYAHLFGPKRVDLSAVAEPLLRLQGGRCFYCGRRVAAVHVDHFLPWAQYPDDRLENLVATDGPCNLSKSDRLAADDHLDAWLARFTRNEAGAASIVSALQHEAENLRWPVDPNATLAVARHLYARHPSEARLWSNRTFRPWDRDAVMRRLSGVGDAA